MKTAISAVVGLSMLAMVVSGCGTVLGAGAGAGAGAAVAAGTKNDVGKGALIGAGIGGAAGAIYDITKKK
jgi:osmotically inducible lipoprotein OsmB